MHLQYLRNYLFSAIHPIFKDQEKIIEEDQTHQIKDKIFANAGFGIFGNEYFERQRARLKI